jgi:hypothetical protein
MTALRRELRMRLGLPRRFAETGFNFTPPPLRSRRRRSRHPGSRLLRLEPEQTRSRLARGMDLQANRDHRGRAWPGTQNEGEFSIYATLAGLRMIAAVCLFALCGLAAPDVATAQSKKEKAPQATAQPSPTKPKVPSGSDPGGIAVAIIGSGVNYTLPGIASRLARDGEGDIIGLDFIDRDNRPFDVAEPDATPDGIRPMGTTLASVLLAAAPQARLIPVRLPPGEPNFLAAAAAFVARTPARIALVANAGPSRVVWSRVSLTPFQQATASWEHILFVIPAGDDDLNIDMDEKPRFPASLGLVNAIVVSGTRADGRTMLPFANWGPNVVDLAVPAEQLPALSVDGAAVQVSGSNYAAARIAALAARLLAANAKLTTAELKALVEAAAAPVPEDPKTGVAAMPTRLGAIANPESVTYKGQP